MTGTAVADQLRELGVRVGCVLLVHASFRAIRPVEGGPGGLIAALRDAIGSDGTLVMPSWAGDDDRPFDPISSPASPDLGVVADTFWRLPGVLRSDHFHAFAAAGPAAGAITSDPLPLPPHIPASPVGRVYDLDGDVLLLGVGHDANSILHLAELLAGVPYRVPKYCTVLQAGRPVRINYGENDHCCARFALADKWLRMRGLQSEGRVGVLTLGLRVLETLSELRKNTWVATRCCSSIPQVQAVASAMRREEAHWHDGRRDMIRRAQMSRGGEAFRWS